MATGGGTPKEPPRSEIERRDAEPQAPRPLRAAARPGPVAPESPARCPTCGEPVPEGFRFCGQCGRALSAALQPSSEGTITILFTDIEDSTSLASLVGQDRALDILRDHYSIVRSCIQRNGGFEVKTQGDGFMVAFAGARRAILAAVDIQRCMAQYNRERPHREVLVRIGINAGDTLRHEDDLFGVAVNLASRIAAWARGGQILVSGLVRGLAGPVGGITYVPRGRIEARGFSYRFRVYEVQWGSGSPPDEAQEKGAEPNAEGAPPADRRPPGGQAWV